MMRQLKEYNASWELVCEAFNIKPQQKSQMRKVAESALGKDYRVYLMDFDKRGKVVSKDISTLDPFSEDESVAGWGGLTEFSSRFGDSVRKAVNESGR